MRQALAPFTAAGIVEARAEVFERVGGEANRCAGA